MTIDTSHPYTLAPLSRRPTRRVNLIDSLASQATLTPMFARGLGDGLGAGLLAELEARFLRPPTHPELKVKWMTLPYTERGLVRMRGFFETPSRDLPLPAATRAAYFELILPQGSSPAIRPPICIYAASAGDQGLGHRRRFVVPLVHKGIGALLLANPYYGLRRPDDQHGFSLHTVADHLMMNLTTIEELRALTRWLHGSGFEHVGLAGYSMGGYVAAAAATTTYARPVALVAIATSASASPVFTRSPMANAVDWASLAGTLGPRGALGALLERFSLERLPAPADAALVTLLGARHDAVCSPEEVIALARHWGITPRWLPGGHVSSLWRGRQASREAILDAFSLLLARSGR